MDVKVNNHKSWLGLSTLEASSDVTRLVVVDYDPCQMYPGFILNVSFGAEFPS